MFPRSFWSGVAVPRSKSAMIVGVLLHFVAKSFCVMVVPLSFLASERALEMAWPITVPTVLGLMMSSERSTLVRRWPSVFPDCAAVSELYYIRTFATRTQVGLTAVLAVVNCFLSVARMAPLRWAAFSAALPLTTVSRGPAAPPRVRAPILVTESQSSDMLKWFVCGEKICVVWGG